MFRIFIAMIALSAISYSSDEFMEFGEKGYFDKNKKESKILFEMGANYIDYPTALPSFSGKHQSYNQDKKVYIWGTDLTWGYEQHLFGSLSTTLRFGGFYNKTFDETKGQAAKDIKIDKAFVQSKYEIYGAQASLSLNYLVDNSVLPFQPFVEFGLGKGFSVIDETYDFKGAGTDPKEKYDVNVKEDFASAKVSVGINFISSKGLFSYFKASQASLLFNRRKINTDISVGGVDDARNGDSTESNKTASSTSYALGLGILF